MGDGESIVVWTVVAGGGKKSRGRLLPLTRCGGFPGGNIELTGRVSWRKAEVALFISVAGFVTTTIIIPAPDKFCWSV